MKFSTLIISAISVLLICQFISFIKSSSIQTNTVLCSYNNNEINIQSTDYISCSFIQKKNSSGICFDDKANTCVPSADNNYECNFNPIYLTCIGPTNIVCTSLDTTCSIINKKFYGNGALLTSNQFVSKQSNWSSASSLLPFKSLLVLLLAMVMLLN